MAEPAKLELITRKPGEPGFQIHEILSSQAHLQYRPLRIPQTSWEIIPQPQSLDGSRTFILKNLQRDRYLLLDAKENFLWEYFDGTHSLEEIARSFHLKFGAFDYAIIRQLLSKMYGAGLLAEPTPLVLQRRIMARNDQRPVRALKKLQNNWRRLSFRLPNADLICSVLFRRGGFLLFHWITFWCAIGIATCAAVVAIRLGANAKQFTRILGTVPLLSTAAIVGTLFTASMLHVLVHALACKSYHRQVREIGFFLLQGVLPTFYADVTDIFMSTRRARLIVDLSGPMVEVVLGSIAFLAAYGSGSPVYQALLFGIGVLLWEAALLNLYPFNFLEMDGYNVVADLLAMPTLRQQALALVPKLPQRLRSPRTMERTEWIQIGYLLLCFASAVVYLVVHLDALMSLLPKWHWNL
jgi:putative peptide zinc metalloprotease protein